MIQEESGNPSLIGRALAGTFFRTLMTGGSGAVLSIIVTYVCVEFIFGKEDYFTAYLVGVALGVVYAFAVFAFAVFKTTEKLLQRFILFMAYMALLVVVQASVVRSVVPIVGIDYYLAVITMTIAVLSVVNYFVYSRFIFQKEP